MAPPFQKRHAASPKEGSLSIGIDDCYELRLTSTLLSLSLSVFPCLSVPLVIKLSRDFQLFTLRAFSALLASPRRHRLLARPAVKPAADH